jgi:pimeloyl-ACP methyl ester carboxylesterase
MRTTFLLRCATTAGLMLGSTACATFEVNEKYFLHPTPDRPLTAESVARLLPAGYRFEEHRIPSAEDGTLHAVLLRHPQATQTVLYFGGNMFRISQHGVQLARQLAPLGVNILLVDHRGYGGSTGTPTTALLARDAVTAYDYLRGLRGIAGDEVVVHGQSLGSFMAGSVADQRPVAGLVLESSATTVGEWARYSTPWFAKPFVRVRVDPALRQMGNLAVVQRLQRPLLVLVGARDNQAPPALSRRLFSEAAVPAGMKRLHVFPNAGHNNVPAQPDFHSVYREFLSTAASTRTRPPSD